jgi:hypothetical protein
MAIGDILGLTPGKLDKSGNTIIWIYAKKAPEYGVYRDPLRVSVHFADEDLALEAKQRATLAVLSPLRGQIAGLIDGWRDPVELEAEVHHLAAGKQADGGKVEGAESKPDKKRYSRGPIGWFQRGRDKRNRSRAIRYDRRVADALIMGLEGSTPEAVALLTDIRNDIVSERKSIAQADYMLWAALAGLAFLLLTWVISSPGVGLLPNPPAKGHLIWTGAAAGTLGAFFSIATGLRNRTILIDLQKWDNRSDAILRIAVGTIGAGILLCLLLAQWVTLVGVTDKLITGTNDDALVMALAIGFVAGFSERAVGDLLAKAGESITDAAPNRDVAVEQAKAAAAAAAQTPLIPAPVAESAPTVAVDPATEAIDESPCDSPPVEGEVRTADVDLPVAVGGVSADVLAPAAPAKPPAGKERKNP